MTDLRKAAEMALESLEGYPLPFQAPIKEALRQALEQPEQEPLGGEWVPCVKLPVIVHVRNQRDEETYISTREGITPVLPDDLIMRGVAGEEYPIGRELFERTYTFDVDAVNTSQESADETAKSEHEYVIDCPRCGHCCPERKWVGLTDEERFLDECRSEEEIEYAKAIEAKLKEKNCSPQATGSDTL